MNGSSSVVAMRDNGGRRSGIDRRRFSYRDHIPERRSGLERRSGSDRRAEFIRKEEGDRRITFS